MQSSGSRPGSKLASLQAYKIEKILFMKRMKDCTIEVTSLQALKQTNRRFKPASQRLKLQARVHKLQYPRAWVQANLPLIRGTSNKDKCIQIMFHVKANLVG